MEQDEEVICKISKDSDINNQYLVVQKEITKNLLQPNYENGKQFFTEKEKERKATFINFYKIKYFST